jgi:hypothetical protein
MSNRGQRESGMEEGLGDASNQTTSWGKEGVVVLLPKSNMEPIR